MTAPDTTEQMRAYAIVRWAARICRDAAARLWKAGRRAEAAPLREVGKDIWRRHAEVVPSNDALWTLQEVCVACERVTALLRSNCVHLVSGPFTDGERLLIERLLAGELHDRVRSEAAARASRWRHVCDVEQYEWRWTRALPLRPQRHLNPAGPPPPDSY